MQVTLKKVFLAENENDPCIIIDVIYDAIKNEVLDAQKIWIFDFEREIVDITGLMKRSFPEAVRAMINSYDWRGLFNSQKDYVNQIIK